jgi:hypothetical protein
MVSVHHNTCVLGGDEMNNSPCRAQFELKQERMVAARCGSPGTLYQSDIGYSTWYLVRDTPYDIRHTTYQLLHMLRYLYCPCPMYLHIHDRVLTYKFYQ